MAGTAGRGAAVIPRLWLIGGGALAVLALASWGLWQRAAAIQARAELQAAQVQLAAAEAREAQAIEAGKVHRAHLARIEAQAAAAAARDAEVLGSEGADAPASDYLRRAVDRVR